MKHEEKMALLYTRPDLKSGSTNNINISLKK